VSVPRIGVLALQGAFSEHIAILKRLGVDPVEVRLPEHLEGLDGLIIPGGESTTIGKLATLYGLMEPLRMFAAVKPMWGTCAGMIFMANELGQDQPILGVMDITVERNAFGRQVDSFETELRIPALDNGTARPFPAVFIRAPRLRGVNTEKGTRPLAQLPDGSVVAAQQGTMLVTAFHPELTGDDRFHRYFLTLVGEKANRR